MRFLANENFPNPSIAVLKNAGYQVLSIADQHPGISDDAVIDKAQADDLIILTFDKDYGEIIYKHGYENPPAVIFFRFKGATPDAAGRTLIDLLNDANLNIENRFTVIERESIRQRAYR